MKYLIIGLGNIGLEYENTRHNIGFDILDIWAAKFDATFKLEKLAARSELKFRGKKLVLIKPSTYMNLSGKAVQYWLSVEKIRMENCLIITDDIALSLGKVRMRTKGSAGGHNGLQNIIDTLQTEQFNRIKVGIGNDYPRGRQVEYVLGKWLSEEIPSIDQSCEKAIEMIESFIIKGAERTMNELN
jgi:PTH1 family peptidyl-tRNA hydrolase